MSKCPNFIKKYKSLIYSIPERALGYPGKELRPDVSERYHIFAAIYAEWDRPD
jgi:hypothetical protein